MEKRILVMATASSMEEGERIAAAVVREQLAACCNIVPGIRSIYTWKGEICDEKEVLLLMKTRADLFTPLKERVRELHSYEVPEIISFTIDSGLDDYLAWIGTVTKG